MEEISLWIRDRYPGFYVSVSFPYSLGSLKILGGAKKDPLIQLLVPSEVGNFV